jgi:hypothetical protein
MRLWTLHPRYLDAQGLVAAWREALLAQKVLLGKTKGYRHHPQLIRFQAQVDPIAAIATFLDGLAAEASARQYRFDASKILPPRLERPIIETEGQLLFEWGHLNAKLRVRSPSVAKNHESIAIPEPHPLFHVVPGAVRTWEKQ